MSDQSFWYEMKLDDIYGLDNSRLVTRVPGGWVMSSYHENGADISTAMCFIPYDTEFKD